VDDYLARAGRVVAATSERGLAGVLVTPGPDLVWLTGYRPTAITERLTVLVLAPDKEPTLVVPVLERPDAEAAEGVRGMRVIDWADATDRL
jgi:Xaa-Pro aminopeptidase